MARYRKIDVRVWIDERFRELSRARPNGQTLWIYLLTNPETVNVPGLYRTGEAAIAEALGWDLRGFRRAFTEIAAREMAVADWKARVVWIPKAIIHNPPENPNVVKGWASTWDEIPECSLKAEAWSEMKGFLEGLGEGFLKPFLEGCAKPFVKGFPEGFGKSGAGTGTVGDSVSSLRSETGASAPLALANGTRKRTPPEPGTREALTWNDGVAFMTARGVPEPQARSLIGQAKSALGDEGCSSLVGTMIAKQPEEPKSWFSAALAKRKPAPVPTSSPYGIQALPGYQPRKGGEG